MKKGTTAAVIAVAAGAIGWTGAAILNYGRKSQLRQRLSLMIVKQDAQLKALGVLRDDMARWELWSRNLHPSDYRAIEEAAAKGIPSQVRMTIERRITVRAAALGATKEAYDALFG